MARRKFSREFKVLAKAIIVLRPVIRFFFRWAQPVIVELLARLIWPRGSQSLMGNFEGSNRSSRSCISTEKDDADQPRGINKHGPMLPDRRRHNEY
jgi:hypothetical protein